MAALTLDASVFASACNEREPGCGASRALLSAVRDFAVPLIEPAIMPVEVAAALRRGRGDEKLAREYAETLIRLSHLTLVPVERNLALRALGVAARHSLRGADAIYVATALRYGAILVTLDTEQRRRAPKAARPCTPDEALTLTRP
jgi:predicted nucleic acid-binding protein